MLTKPIHLSLAVVGLLSILGLNIAGTQGTNTYSISPAEFNPIMSDCYYEISGASLFEGEAPVGLDPCDLFQVGIHLPDGVMITKITLYFRDDSYNSLPVYLKRNNFNLSSTTIATISTTGTQLDPSSTSINTSIIIDNSAYSYYFYVDFWSHHSEVLGITLETSYPTFLSVIKR
jgi:hypothetical protein